MANDRDDEPEGWEVPVRIAAITGLAVPILLGVAVLVAGVIYDHTLRPKVGFSVTPQPAPGLDAAIHAGGGDPEISTAPRPVDPRIERAKAEIAAQGIAGWNSQ